jgi:hypothetical protein
LVDNQDLKALIEVLENEENLNTQESAYLQKRGKQGGTWMLEKPEALTTLRRNMMNYLNLRSPGHLPCQS